MIVFRTLSSLFSFAWFRAFFEVWSNELSLQRGQVFDLDKCDKATIRELLSTCNDPETRRRLQSYL